MATFITRFLAATPDEDTYLALLRDYADNLCNRFARLGNLSDLEDAVVVRRLALKLTPNGRAGQRSELNEYGLTLQVRFNRLGELKDLEEAITAHQRALDITPDGHSDKNCFLIGLGTALQLRFDRLGSLQDLEDAVALKYRAVKLTHDSDTDRLSRLHSLSLSLLSRYHRFGQLQDIDDVIAVQRRIVEPTSDNQITKSSHLDDLSSSLQSRFDRRGALPDLEEAISTQRRALDLTPDDHPDLPSRLDHLAVSLESRWRIIRAPEDIEHAISVQRRAVELTPDNHPKKPSRLSNLGVFLRPQLCHSPSRSRVTMAYDDVSASHPMVCTPTVKLRAARINSRMCTVVYGFDRLRDNTAIRARQAVLDAIRPCISLSLSISHRLEQLTREAIGPEITATAATAIAAGKHCLALEWLEEGRNVVWSQIMRLRRPLDDLRSRDSDLAEQLRQVSVALESAGRRVAMDGHGHRRPFRDAITPEGTAFITPTPYATLDEEMKVHIQLAAEYERLLAQIRKMKGFEDFMCPITLADLAPACKDGPVAVINVDRSRCDALILYRTAVIVHVPLPDLSFEAVVKMYLRLAIATGGRTNKCRRSIRDGRASRPPQESGVHMKRILELLWKRVVQPILAAIRDEQLAIHAVARPGGNRLPHITWCATGPLSFLPLHAAGVYDEKDFRAPKAFDFVVSSYTPSVSALLAVYAQSTVLSATETPKILVISQPRTPGQKPLPSTVAEAVKVCDHFPQSYTHLSDRHATVNAVLEAMGQHDWVHLACHGAQDAHNPIDSAFFLHDGRLDLSCLMGISSVRARLAVLSACQTAKGSDKLPEEAVHLAAGMLAVGYRSVVATIWSIKDEDGPVIMDAFYSALKRNIESDEELAVAYALHEAVAKLRNTAGEGCFIRWVPFVHFGM
ncbi:CHAT domain-containing protein [Vararia minispora EC-137]|uniref:CHAT domain-containing protein n=1 Tax=Vararia minispora EC-137 TaxID=1314806 RepID=A0ACB8Q594_9AGAM|nr:CHAT domain-containing protein [Vararia minispora EC-137]